MSNFWYYIFVFISVVASGVQSVDCNQIQDSQIFDGSKIYLWGNSSGQQSLPANFNCNFTIPAPLNTTVGYYAQVSLGNGLQGVNDYITVIDTTGAKSTLNSRSSQTVEYYVIPGREMSIQVVTKSVLMNSRVSILVGYYKVKFGPTKQMETGSTMNIIDLSTLRGSEFYGRKFSSSVTYVGSEQIYVTACSMHDWMPSFQSYFLIDGTVYNQKNVYTLDDLTFYKSFVTTNNTVTVLSFQYPESDVGVVLNPLSEAAQFSKITSMASTIGQTDDLTLDLHINEKQAVQIVDFFSNNITLKVISDYASSAWNCNGRIVDGPPNNSSKVVVELQNVNRWITYPLNLSRFSLIAETCDLRLSAESNTD